jgi:hypothetical protein
MSAELNHVAMLAMQYRSAAVATQAIPPAIEGLNEAFERALR